MLNNKPLQISLLSTHRVNVGDEFIREGVLAILDRSELPYTPLTINKHDQSSLYRPIADDTYRVQNKYWDSDVCIQSGAPVYWHLNGGAAKSTNSEWSSWFYDDLLFQKETDRQKPLFLNLGAGSCDPWGKSGDEFLSDPDCRRFAKLLGQGSAITTVRDPVAHKILNDLHVDNTLLPCPAFLAASRWHGRFARARDGVIGLNLMPQGSHYDLSNAFNSTAWNVFCLRLVSNLRKFGKLIFIAHNKLEFEFSLRFASSDEHCFLSNSWLEYIDIYSRCNFVVANRVHGAVVASGFGTPTIILGDDTRAQIGDKIGIPRFHVHSAKPDEVLESFSTLVRDQTKAQERLDELSKSTMATYVSRITPVLESARCRSLGGAHHIGSKLALASVQAVESQEFRNLSTLESELAQTFGFEHHDGWSKDWEHPFAIREAWTACLTEESRILDVGAGLSPVPWILAMGGAKVTIMDKNPNLKQLWLKIQDKFPPISIDFIVGQIETTDFDEEIFDLVISTSVLHEVADRESWIKSAMRVTKPGGTIISTFDIIDPSMPMKYPENGHTPLSKAELQSLLATCNVKSRQDSANWNINDLPAFIQWHLESASHHSYGVGGFIIKKEPREKEVHSSTSL